MYKYRLQHLYNKIKKRNLISFKGRDLLTMKETMIIKMILWIQMKIISPLVIVVIQTKNQQ